MRFFLPILAISFFNLSLAMAEDEKFEIGGSARVRAEFRDNSDFDKTAKDYKDFIGSRFRLDMKFKANEQVNVFFQPQFTKVWGDTEWVPSAAGTNTATSTSGTTNDTPLDVHQAYVKYSVNDPIGILIGRKELNYGDQLLVGGVGWNNTGRAFDLMQLSYKYEIGSVEVFTSKVKDTNISAAGPGDKDFSGIYSANKISDKIQNADAYVFYNSDSTTATEMKTTAVGLRLKSPVDAFDYRGEFTFERTKVTGAKSDDNQLDLEAGYVFHQATKGRVAIEYFSATDNFDQLYPTGHKWLGYADLLARRNIKGFRLGLSSQCTEKLNVALDYHKFQRQNTDAPAYKFDGTAYPGAGTDSAIGSEVDLVLSYKLQDNLTVEGGAARVTPDDYLKTNMGEDAASFYYLQANTTF